MISKRYKRPARPQENLRQFALNNSKGVDSTKAPTDFDTISRSNNLVVNPDGSLSLRKPIEYVKNTSRRIGVKQYYLYDGVHKLEVFNNSFKITKNEDTVPVKVKYINTAETEVVKEYPYSIDGLIIPNGDAEIVNLNSATIVGNCNVVLTELGADAVDLNLYDDVTVSDTGALKLSLPRYLRIYYSDTEQAWIVQVQPPEINTISSAEGEISFNPNTTLDNMFALRDTYDVVVPSVKGILAYAPSKVDNGKIIYDPGIQIDFSRIGYAEGSATGVMSLANVQPGGAAQESDYWPVFSEADVSCGLSGEFTWDHSNFNNLSTRLTVNVTQAGKTYSDNTVCNITVQGTVRYSYTFKDNPKEHIWSTKTISSSKTIRAELLENGVEVELSDFNNSIPLVVYGIKADISVHVTCSISKADTQDAWITVADITESNKSTRYRPVTFLKKDACRNVILKAFCNIPNIPNIPDIKYFANWFTSKDSINWEPLDTFERGDGVNVRQINPMWKPADNVEDSEQVYDYVTYPYYPLNGVSQNDHALLSTISSENLRIDTVYATLPDDTLSNVSYRFSVIAVEQISDTDPEWATGISGAQYRVWATVSQQEYTPVFKSECEFLHSEFANSVNGKKLYSGKAIYSYGSEKFFNNIFVSDIDSFITPLYNVIDLDTYAASQATCLVPWRDYLVSATNNAIYLHTRTTDGFLTKTVNTSIGVSEQDSRCCKAVLNGILFKSGPKVYQLYPNLYSGDDSTLNLTEISRAVEDYLEEYTVGDDLPFAFSTESEYVLMLPNTKDTTCLRYDYSSKLWTVCTYPIVATDYKIVNIDDIRIFGKFGTSSAEFKFDSSVKTDVYGDIMPDGIVPIEFEWDTGQKTDNISIAKQFVESKIVFATEDLIEAFPMELTVAIDGDPHVTVLDVNSDAPFWKTDDSKGVLNTALRLGDSESSGVLRQLIVRYSGKGRSIRHILSGSPTSNFRLYETYVRYKTLNIKR